MAKTSKRVVKQKTMKSTSEIGKNGKSSSNPIIKRKYTQKNVTTNKSFNKNKKNQFKKKEKRIKKSKSENKFKGYSNKELSKSDNDFIRISPTKNKETKSETEKQSELAKSEKENLCDLPSENGNINANAEIVSIYSEDSVKKIDVVENNISKEEKEKKEIVKEPEIISEINQKPNINNDEKNEEIKIENEVTNDTNNKENSEIPLESEKEKKLDLSKNIEENLNIEEKKETSLFENEENTSLFDIQNKTNVVSGVITAEKEEIKPLIVKEQPENTSELKEEEEKKLDLDKNNEDDESNIKNDEDKHPSLFDKNDNTSLFGNQNQFKQLVTEEKIQEKEEIKPTNINIKSDISQPVEEMKIDSTNIDKVSDLKNDKSSLLEDYKNLHIFEKKPLVNVGYQNNIGLEFKEKFDILFKKRLDLLSNHTIEEKKKIEITKDLDEKINLIRFLGQGIDRFGSNNGFTNLFYEEFKKINIDEYKDESFLNKKRQPEGDVIEEIKLEEPKDLSKNEMDELFYECKLDHIKDLLYDINNDKIWQKDVKMIYDISDDIDLDKKLENIEMNYYKDEKDYYISLGNKEEDWNKLEEKDKVIYKSGYLKAKNKYIYDKAFVSKYLFYNLNTENLKSSIDAKEMFRNDEIMKNYEKNMKFYDNLDQLYTDFNKNGRIKLEYKSLKKKLDLIINESTKFKLCVSSSLFKEDKRNELKSDPNIKKEDLQIKNFNTLWKQLPKDKQSEYINKATLSNIKNERKKFLNKIYILKYKNIYKTEFDLFCDDIKKYNNVTKRVIAKNYWDLLNDEIKKKYIIKTKRYNLSLKFISEFIKKLLDKYKRILKKHNENLNEKTLKEFISILPPEKPMNRFACYVKDNYHHISNELNSKIHKDILNECRQKFNSNENLEFKNIYDTKAKESLDLFNFRKSQLKKYGFYERFKTLEEYQKDNNMIGNKK